MPLVKLDDVGIYYEINGTGSPLVLIFGYGGNLDGWNHIVPFAKTLSKHFKVITLDNRGTGRSSSPEGPYSIPTMADDVANLLEYLNIPKAHVLGESMGGMIAQEVALRHPEKVERLVLVCTGPGGDAYNVSGQMDSLEKNSWMYNPPKGMSGEDIMNGIFGVAVYPRFLESHRMQLMEPSSDYPTSASTLEKHFMTILDHNTCDRLGDIGCETLIFHGENDKLLFPYSGKVLAESIPNARLVWLTETGHDIIDERGLEVIPQIISFLS